jgi:hypothetical protein
MLIFAGLRRRSLGLFKSSSTAALLQKISKENEDAGAVIARWEGLLFSRHFLNFWRESQI